MNEQFSEEQIKAYASAFETGDAIWCNGKWYEVVENKKNGNNKLTAYADGNIFVINDGQDGEYQSGTPYGFWIRGNPYRVTTLTDYKLQGGEKIVCLKEYHTGVTFGKVYDVYILEQTTQPVFRGDDGIVYNVGKNEWGVIPRYEQVAPKELQEDSTLNILEQKLIELCKEYDELHKDILEKQRYERKLAEVVTNLEETIDSLKRIGDV